MRWADPVERFWSKVKYDVSDEDCWNWLGFRNAGGYGLMSVKGKKVFAHRISYMIRNGAIPEGMVLDHLCMNPSCVNPAHLEAVTSGENTRRYHRWRVSGETILGERSSG